MFLFGKKETAQQSRARPFPKAVVNYSISETGRISVAAEEILRTESAKLQLAAVARLRLAYAMKSK